MITQGHHDMLASARIAEYEPLKAGHPEAFCCALTGHSGVAVRPSGMSCTGAGEPTAGPGGPGRMPAGVTPRQATAVPGFPPSARPVAARSGRSWRDSPAGPIEGAGGAEYLAEAGRPPLPGGRGMGGQAMRNRAPALGAALLLGITAGMLGVSASASGSAASALAVKPKPS